jgi:hypothetical protein
MGKNIFAIRIILTFLASLLFVPQHAVAQEMEWTIKTERNLEATPLDTAVSADGRLIFILSPGEILVYSVLQQKVINHIPVDKRFDRVTFSRADNTLIVTSSSEKVLKTIQLEFIQNIDITGLPFKGPANAPVTVAVFNDYQ